MPGKVAPPSMRDNAAGPASTLVSSHHCTYPVWDDAQIAQENWGSLLTATTASAAGLSDALQDGGRTGSAKPKSSGGHGASINTPPVGANSSVTGGVGAESHFEDAVGHQCVAVFIQSSQPHTTPPEQTDAAISGGATGNGTQEVVWKRPADIFRPFRPVVHRNATPFVNPYAAQDALTPLEGKVEEEVNRAPSSGGASNGNVGGNKKSTAGATRNADGAAAVTELFHQQYPEAVTVLEDFVGDDATRWSHCTCVDAVRRYRALPALMQPYDGALVAGCAETPAEACGSRYSTALRHKLKQAEQLSALAEAPPFLMTALDSALLAVEQAQRYIPAGSYLWELVHPHAPGTCHPVYNPHGKYAVKLFVAGAYRKVVVDDRLPVDVLGRPLLSTTALKELWPALLGKAIVKALGPVTGVEALAKSPELIVSTLLGNWVPQYLSPRHDTVATMSTLLLYERHLKRLAASAQPIVTQTDGDAAKNGEHANGDDADGGNKKDVKSGNGGGGGGASAARRKSSATRKRASTVAKNEVGGAADSPAGGLLPLTASEFCAEVVDEPIPEQVMYVCGLHAAKPQPSKAAARAGDEAKRAAPSFQLLTIHAIKPFRNTFAVLLHTTPTLQLSEGVFDKEKDADDVSALQRWSRHHTTIHPSRPPTASVSCGVEEAAAEAPATEMVMLDNARRASVTTCWLTVEEFTAQMDQVVVWRVVEGKYAHTKSIAGETVLQHNGVGRAADNAETSATSATSAQAGKGGAGKTPSPAREESTAPAAAAAATPSVPPRKVKPSTTASRVSPYASTLSPTCVWWRLTATEATEAVVVVSSPTLTEADRVAVAVAESATGEREDVGVSSLSLQQRRVDFHHFEYERAEVLNHVGSLLYADGALRSTVLRFRPGTHLLRVDLHNVHAADTVSFLSNAAMDVQLALAHDFAQDGFATVMDAGSYPAMPSFDVEYIWLKRVFTLSQSTCMTVVLSTLDDADDVAAHRSVNTITQRATVAAPVGGKAAHGKGVAAPPTSPPAPQQTPSAVNNNNNSNNNRSAAPSSSPMSAASTKKNSSTGGTEGRQRQLSAITSSPAAGAGGAGDAEEPAEVALLRYTHLLLVNLDNPDDFRVGSAGRLVQLRLEPNEKGYLIVAYTIVPETAAAHFPGREARLHAVTDEDGTALRTLPLTLATAAAAATTATAATSPRIAISPPPSPAASPLFPAGQWALTLRSDAELNAFDAIVHNVHDVAVEADLQRGGSPVLFRRVCAVTEATHLSILAQLHTPLPMSYTVRISRAGVAAAGTELTSTATTASAKNANAAASVVSPTGGESPFPMDDTAAAHLSVLYESDPTPNRLFVADVLLPCVSETNVKAGKAAGGASGGGGAGGAGGAPTTYLVEACVSQADASAWNEECRRHQEKVFVQVREVAEERAAAMQQSDLDEFQHDPEAFLHRRKETAAQRRQLLTESAEKTVSTAQVDGGGAAAAESRSSRARSSSTSRRQSRRVSNAVDNFIKDAFRRPSSSTLEDAASDAATLSLLDSVDPAAQVHLSLQLSFSSSRAELRDDVPPPDPVAELRQHMRDTMAWLQERIGGSAAGGGRNGLSSAGVGAAAASTTSAAGGGPSPNTASANAKSPAPRNQRDGAAAASSVEDALRAKMARQSRLAYLRNPRHLFLPSFEVVDGHDEAVAAVATGANTAAPSPSGGGGSTGKSRQHDSGAHQTGASSSSGAAGVSAAAAATTTTTTTATTTPPSTAASRGTRKESMAVGAARLSSIASIETTPSMTPAHGPEVVLHDGIATHFRYAAPLTPSQYCVELLPLRSYEEAAPTTVIRDKESAGAGGAAAAASNKRPKAATAASAATTTAAAAKGGNAAAGTAAGGGVMAGAAGAPGSGISIVGPSTLAHPLTTAECDALVWPLQAPLLEAMKAGEAAAASARPLKAEHRLHFRTGYQTYFEALAAKKASVAAAAAAQNSSDVVESVVRPVVYHSLLGIKEDDVAMNMKSKKSMAST